MADEASKLNVATGRLIKPKNMAITLAALAIFLIIAVFLVSHYRPAPELRKITLDYAYYNPSSLVLKKFGWLEESFKAAGIEVKWVHSAGSNRAIQYLSVTSRLDSGSLTQPI